MTDEGLERNKAVARAVFDVWSTGDTERLDELGQAFARLGSRVTIVELAGRPPLKEVPRASRRSPG